jgi:drug/metabolite transporter (DMT)-like permease
MHDDKQAAAAAAAALEAAAVAPMVGLIKKAVLIAVYLMFNIGLNLLNKILMVSSGFAFPLTLCITHMAFSFVFLIPFMIMMPRYKDMSHLATIQAQRNGLLLIGTCFALNIGLNNMSLLSISLSLNQIIRSAIPVVAAAASFYLEGRRVSRLELIALLILIFGVAMTVADRGTSAASSSPPSPSSSQFSSSSSSSSDNSSSSHSAGAAPFWGLVACILSTLANGVMMSASGMVVKEKIDAMRLTFYQSPIVVACLAPFLMLLEGPALVEYVRAASSTEEGRADGTIVGMLLLLTCLLAVSYNIVHVAVIEHTSAVTTTVIGEAKIVMIVCLSSLILGERDILSPLTALGATVAMVGLVMYGHVRLRARAAAASG